MYCSRSTNSHIYVVLLVRYDDVVNLLLIGQLLHQLTALVILIAHHSVIGVNMR